MARNVCWSFSPVAPGQAVFIVTCPRLIEALLSPRFRADQPDDMGNYGPYIDGALAAADADEEPGIFRGAATGAPAPQDVPFAHALVSAEIDRARTHTLTRPIFEKAAAKLDAHYAHAPWHKPKPVKRGQGALDALLDEQLGEGAKEFKQALEIDDDGPAEAAPTFLGIVLPEDETSQHLLTVVLNLVNHRIWLESELTVKRMQGYL